MSVVSESSKLIRKKLKKKKEDDCSSSSWFPSSWEGQGVGSLLANAACDTQAGGDGGQDGCYCLNDEFPSILLHDVH